MQEFPHGCLQTGYCTIWTLYCTTKANFQCSSISRTTHNRAGYALMPGLTAVKFVMHNHLHMGSIWGENDRPPAIRTRATAEWKMHCEKGRNFTVTRTACGHELCRLWFKARRLILGTYNHLYMADISYKNDRSIAIWTRATNFWKIHCEKGHNLPVTRTACEHELCRLRLKPIRLKVVTRHGQYVGSFRPVFEPNMGNWAGRALWQNFNNLRQTLHTEKNL